MYRDIGVKNRLWISGLTVVFLVAVWFALSGFGWVSSIYLPSPKQVGAAFIQLIHDGYLNTTLWQHLLYSLARVLMAVFFSVLIAIPLGVLAGLYQPVKAIFDPIIEIYRPIPPLAYLPLIVIWCGIGEVSKVLLIVIAIIPPLFIATATAVAQVQRQKIQVAQALGASSWQVVKHIVLPSSLPSILTGLSISLGVGWSTLVAAELIAATKGLGFMTQSASQLLQTDVVLAGIILITLIAVLLELLLRQLKKQLTPWHKQ